MKVTKVAKVERASRSALTTSRVAPMRRNSHPGVIHNKAFEQGISEASTPEVSKESSLSFRVAFFIRDLFVVARIFFL